MTLYAKSTALVLIMGAASGIWLCCRLDHRFAEVPRTARVSTPAASRGGRMDPSLNLSDLVVDESILSQVSVEESFGGVLVQQQQAELIKVEPAEHLLQLIPDWLHEHGDLRRERIELAGHWIERVRSRYEWPGGSQLEVEVADLGVDASEEQFISLGFDLDLNPDQEARSIRMIDDGQQDWTCNLEYDQENEEGVVQYIVAGRYLMEVKIQGLPLESFQEMEDRDHLLATLQCYVEKKGVR